jgi:hypothetical protein
MTTTTKNQEKYLINCQEGANHIERATISFILAVTASKTSEAAVLITSGIIQRRRRTKRQARWVGVASCLSQNLSSTG